MPISPTGATSHCPDNKKLINQYQIDFLMLPLEI